MNMQIQELLFESGICAKNGLGQVETSKAALEQFAKLIVRECASISYKTFDNGDEIAMLLMNIFEVEV